MTRHIIPPVVFSLEEALEYMEDEYGSYSKSMRMRKVILDETERKRELTKTNQSTFNIKKSRRPYYLRDFLYLI